MEVATKYIGRDIAIEAAPELQMRLGDAVDDAIDKEWRQLRAELYAQDAGLAERSSALLDWCWTRGAISEEQWHEFCDRWNLGAEDRSGKKHHKGTRRRKN